MSDLPPKKSKMGSVTTFRLHDNEKNMEEQLRKAGFDISKMYRDALTSVFCVFTGNDNTWGDE